RHLAFCGGAGKQRLAQGARRRSASEERAQRSFGARHSCSGGRGAEASVYAGRGCNRIVSSLRFTLRKWSPCSYLPPRRGRVGVGVSTVMFLLLPLALPRKGRRESSCYDLGCPSACALGRDGRGAAAECAATQRSGE